MMKKTLIALIVGGAVMTGCASSPNQIAANYVPPSMYDRYDCDRLHDEAMLVSSQTRRLASSMEGQANKDAVMMGVGMVLFWPALFALSGGNEYQQAQYAELKGKADAIQLAAHRKDCRIPGV